MAPHFCPIPLDRNKLDCICLAHMRLHFTFAAGKCNAISSLLAQTEIACGIKHFGLNVTMIVNAVNALVHSDFKEHFEVMCWLLCMSAFIEW